MFYISQQATVPNAKVRPRERRDETAGARGAEQESCECVTITVRSAYVRARVAVGRAVQAPKEVDCRTVEMRLVCEGTSVWSVT